MTKFFKKIKLILVGSLFIGPFLSVSCFSEKEENQWDTDIKFYVPQPNKGYTEEMKTQFEKTLTKYFNEIKNQNSSLKNNPDVSIKLEYAQSSGDLYQKFLANNVDNDFAIMSYSDISKKNNDELLPSVAQTQTLKFLWTPEVTAKFQDKKEQDPLYLMAQQANKLQLEDSRFGSYPLDWIGKETQMMWDGSKYGVFYKNDQYTENFYGSILISGTSQEREQIKKSWLEKDWDTFKSFGILFNKKTSLSKFIVPVSIIAKNFGKTYNEIFEYLSNDNSFVSAGKDPAVNLGIKTSSGKTYKIAFDYDGVFNWTPPTWNPDSAEKTYNFKPTNYPQEQIRYLTMVGPLFYDAVLARKRMPEAQKEIFAQALAKLQNSENTYGTFSGFNKFIPLNDQKLKDNIKTLKNIYE
ncbi:P37-like ABC transporter substrate-binding lipoprotein [Mycoplasmopsis citelli]|uniref:ABC transporter thiamine pyrophosphate-binding lipoprotein p37/Cypl n=1 Tax=Mycoplasmopsis citelli TaxID=171281 RepID=UPI0021142503|nr:P37-like ABC transporter substrate-binding lipoprotein [Mycoplasmopsis citelli]UUD36206.1 P37-like ABC transporter substrate-binding lipoprotein [Mycoplasmopsis citelli]